MLLFCLIFIYPVSRTAIMSFFSVKSVTSAVSTWSWAGLDNYIKLFHTPLFITSVKNIGKIWLYCGIACLGLAIVLAIILTSDLRGQKFFRAIIYMPNVIAAVAVGYMWLLYVYNAKFGLFHSLFTALGWESMANFQWLGTDHMFLSMCIAYVFSNVGYFMLMYIAAILLNCSQDKNPMMAYNHPYKYNKAEGNSNIIIEGGIWDMNGQLDESGTSKNLPNAESINALGIGYGSNITIRNITFRDCYNGHVIQVAGSDNVLIENCRFEGQSFRGSGDKTRELLQIEPGTVKGYPYTLVQNKAPSTNVTIRNCYFGGSENTPHYMAAIGTHSQQAGVKCSDIVIEDCTFDNAAYTAIHFMAYDRITIRNNIFTITSDSEQIDRYGILADTYGSFIDPTGAESTTDFTIEGNTFDVSDPKATVLEITTNNKSPKHIKNVTIKDNTLKGVNGGKAIDLYLLDNCTISGNTIEGFERPIVANSCDEQFISDTDIVTE